MFKRGTIIISALLIGGCSIINPPVVTPPVVIPPPITPPPVDPPVPPVTENFIDKCGALKIDGRFFRCSKTDEPFRWRGITWFRFLHQVVNDEDTSYLAELSSTGFNLIRVLSTAEILFDLNPTAALDNLDRALKVAREHELYVEIVAVIDTARRNYDWRGHARSVAVICKANDNCVYEFANEPGHGVQSPELHELEDVTQFAANAVQGLDLVYSAGSWGIDEPTCSPSIDDCQKEFIDDPRGAYLTPHLDRGRDKWNMVRRVRELERMSSVGNQPVVNDEPVGFDELDGSITGKQRLNDCNIALACILSPDIELSANFMLVTLPSAIFTVVTDCGSKRLTIYFLIPHKVVYHLFPLDSYRLIEPDIYNISCTCIVIYVVFCS